MIISFKKARKTFVLTKKEDIPFPVGIIIDVIVQSEKGRIKAFWVKTKEGLKILQKEDIREWEFTEKIRINSEEKFITPEESQLLKPIFKTEQRIWGAKVWNRNEYKGKVEDFSFDVYSGFIINILVSKGILFWKKKKQIHRSKIVKINEKGIFINENTIQKTKNIESQEELFTSIKTNKNI